MAPPRSNLSFPVRLARQARNAFTLVELLISMAVLVMIILFVGQLVTSTATITVNSGKFLEPVMHFDGRWN
jgi:prepilin-type N-terminal cleavage/methylation domain-containing protein